MKIILIRHGETTWNALGKLQGQADPPLTQKGIDQANNLAKNLQSEGIQITAIFSSERQRALKVAQILGNFLNITVFTDELLNSRNLGDFSGKTLKELENTVPKLYKQYISGELDFAPPNGESARSVLSRNSAFLKKIRQNYNDNDKILVVTHRGNVGDLHFLLTGEKMIDPIRNVKNCTPYHYQFEKIFENHYQKRE